MMRDLRTDMGAVECGADFQRACADINLLPGNPIPGINVNYANIGLQRQNPAERGWQHFKNMQNAIIVGQDLLPSKFWGFAGRAASQAIKCFSNNLCQGQTPIYVFQGVVTDMAKQFRIGYGQAVIATRVAPAPAPKLPETTRNEFGVCVGPGHPSNNSVLVYFPSRGTNYVSIRFNVRVIKLGSKRQMSLEE